MPWHRQVGPLCPSTSLGGPQHPCSGNFKIITKKILIIYSTRKIKSQQLRRNGSEFITIVCNILLPLRSSYLVPVDLSLRYFYPCDLSACQPDYPTHQDVSPLQKYAKGHLKYCHTSAHYYWDQYAFTVQTTPVSGHLLHLFYLSQDYFCFCVPSCCCIKSKRFFR